MKIRIGGPVAQREFRIDGPWSYSSAQTSALAGSDAHDHQELNIYINVDFYRLTCITNTVSKAHK